MGRARAQRRLGAAGLATMCVVLLMTASALAAEEPPADATRSVAVVDVSEDLKENVEIARDVVRAIRKMN
ncbi:MAG: hypothetical protein QF464_10000, partial [Myxococcota bacterium]|nr:hypothetical protein [Myxococcota bacterium]